MKFSKELTYIKDEKIRESAKRLISLLPDYFFCVPASSTGKYHPEFSLGEGGLYRHTKAAVRIAYELLQIEMYRNYYTDEEKDLIILSLMVHDGLKSGLEHSKYTKVDHPMLMANFIKDNKDKLELNDKQISIVTKAIAAHMGEYNKDYDGNEILPKPKTKLEKFVHMCDYLASRKFLNIKFNENNEIEGD